MPRFNPWREHPFAPASGSDLCELEQIPDDNGLELVFGNGPHALRLVVFKADLAAADGCPRAYVNECPHAGIPLEFTEQTFCVYDIDGQRDLLCPHHSAMFHLSDGQCYDGPCQGDRLEAVPVNVDGSKVKVA